jgi:hypothetical protein
MSQEIITRRLTVIKELEDEKKKISQALQDMLDKDEDYIDLKEKANAHRETVKMSKGRIDEKSYIKDFQAQLKDKAKEIKEIKEILSQELADYYRNEGTMQIEDQEGNIKRLKFNVSLIN